MPMSKVKLVLLWRILPILVCLALASPSASALDPDRRISQYAHTAWRVRDGAFAGAPTAIAQTTDGYVWIGTLAGLLRFDGIRFVPFIPPTGKTLPNSAVISLFGSTDGSLWIGTASGVARWKNGELVNFPETAGRVNSIYEDQDGTIWIARSRTSAGGVCKIAASVPKCYTPNDGMPPYAGTVIRDNLGYFLIGSAETLVRWKPGSSTSYELPGLKSKRGLSGISDLALAPDGSVWVGIAWPGHGLGLQQWVNGTWKTPLIAPTFDSSTLRVNSLRLDRQRALWIGTVDAGIYRVHGGDVDHFVNSDGLTSNSVQTLFEDREGNLWVSTTEGVDCFRNTPMVSVSVSQGLSANEVGSILGTRDGTVWIGNKGALDLVRGNVVSSIGPKNGLRGNRVTSLFEDHSGRLWVGLDNGLFVYQDGRFTPVERPDGAPVGIVLAMTEDKGNNVWASVIRNPPGRPTKLICFRDRSFVKEISDPRLDVMSLAADPQSGIWMGLRQGGLARYRNDQVQIFPIRDANAPVGQIASNLDGSVLAATGMGLVELRGDNQPVLDDKNGLPCNRIYAFVTDKHSDLWLYAECGLIKIKSDELQRWREHSDVKVAFDLFDAHDGAHPFIPPFRPVATRSSDGRLWFANDTVAEVIDPDGVLRNPILPPAHIEDVVADRKTYSPQNGLRLPAQTRDLAIDYTALSFVDPQKVQFRYKLEGYDREWQDPKTRRQAFYSNLRPKPYRFRLMASNNAGVWNEQGATLDFSIAPAFYQTWWFVALCAVSGLAFLYMLYMLHLRSLARQFEARMEERVSERTRIARELHDTLLQSFQAVLMKFQIVTDQLSDRPELHRTLETVLGQARQAVSEGRQAVEGLRSSMVVTNDLAGAIRTLGAEIASNSNSPEFRVDVEGTPRDLAPIVRDDVYRIAGEAVRNAFQHAQATRIEVEIQYQQRQLRLSIRDNGRGIDTKILDAGARAGHYGLLGLHERAKLASGRLTVWSEPGSGTEIELTIPASGVYASATARRALRKKNAS